MHYAPHNTDKQRPPHTHTAPSHITSTKNNAHGLCHKKAAGDTNHATLLIGARPGRVALMLGERGVRLV